MVNNRWCQVALTGMVVSCIHFNGVLWANEKWRYITKAVWLILNNYSPRLETFTAEDKTPSKKTCNKLNDSKYLFYSQVKSITTNKTWQK